MTCIDTKTQKEKNFNAQIFERWKSISEHFKFLEILSFKNTSLLFYLTKLNLPKP